MNGRSAVSAEMALRLEKAFGVSMDMLLHMQAGYDAAQMRLRSREIRVKRFSLK
jgi:addiction module HigA family antidote